jgi:uncharacterized protein (TIGR02246 family)
MKTPCFHVIAAAGVGLMPLAAAHAAQADQAAQADDQAAIWAVQAGQEASWNAHDATGYAALFTEDADVVNVLGWWWKSRAELEENLGIAFKSVFAHSSLHIEGVTVRFLTPGLAVAHVTWSMAGAASPDGSGTNIPQRGIQMQLLRKIGNRWLIASFQNTNSVPERPFAPAPVDAVKR